MADSKYGRLFTEADVQAIVWAVLLHRGLNPETARHDTAGALRTLQESDGPLRLTFPPDEPLFLLRAQDEAADAYPLAVYFHQSADVGAGDEHLKGVTVAMREFTAWKLDHPDRVKVPD